MGILHGEMHKLARQKVLADFRAGAFPLMLVSDVAARGLDVADCDAVFHLELPSSASHYAHRAGRTGRMGAPGLCVCFRVGGAAEGAAALAWCRGTASRAAIWLGRAGQLSLRAAMAWNLR